MMQSFLRSPFSSFITLIIGLVVLLGYFVDVELMSVLRARFLQWAVILAAVALLIGVFNLARVHWSKMKEGTTKAIYSFVFFISFVLALLIGGGLGIQHPVTRAIVDYVIIPIEASLFVIVLVILIYALTRLLQNRFSTFSLVFLVTVLVSLVGSIPLLGIEIPLLHGSDSVLAFATRIFGTAGVRGLLIGVAIGSVVTGIRVLLGLDRPHGE